MGEHAQQIPLDGATRVAIDVTGADLVVSWREDLEAVVASGQELTVERAGDELFLRAEHRSRGRNRGGGLFDKLPNISVPGVTIDWGEGGNSIEVSDEDGVIVRTGRPATPGASSIRIELPVAVIATAIELDRGDLGLTSPLGKVECQIKSGNLDSTGGNAEMSTSLGSGNARIKGFSGSLTLMGGSGDVEITDSRAITSIKAGSGEVALTRLHGDAINVMAGSGDVAIRDCVADAFSCHTGSGDLDIAGGELERVSVRSGSGVVSCATAFGPYTQAFETGSGPISLGVPRGMPVRFEVSSHGGDIDSDIQLVSVGQRGPRSRRTRRQVGTVGSGEPRADVSVRTATGDIRLYWLATAAKAQASAPEPPVPPEQPAPIELPGSSVGQEDHADRPTAGDPRQEILEALAAGVITLEEADDLLEKVEKDSAG